MGNRCAIERNEAQYEVFEDVRAISAPTQQEKS